MPKIGRICHHIDTINRKVLDLDFERFGLKDCYGVSACLVCGRYFRGISRNRHSLAHAHSYKMGHHVYMNMKTAKMYCVSDGCEINNHPSLDDFQQAINPRFSRDEVLQLDRNVQWSKAFDGSDYLPGMVGLRNIMETDFVNVTIQALMRVTPLRNFFLVLENYIHSDSEVVQKFGELTRKIWHAPTSRDRLVLLNSWKRLKRRNWRNPILLYLHHGFSIPCISGLKIQKQKAALISDCFKGEFGNTDDKRKRFLMLGLDLPASPVSMDSNIIPEVPLLDILKESRLVTELPQYLILHIRRFTKKSLPKNPTLVNFPLKNLELKDSMIPLLPMPSKYDLIANIVHDAKPSSSYRVFVQQKSQQLWYQIQDLHVAETLPQMVASSEAYMLIYEQQQQQ